MDSQHKALLITDLVDSTILVETLGDHRSGEVFAAIETHIRTRLADLGGLEIDKTDGFLMLFDHPLDAVRFALGVHHDLARLSEQFGVSLASRCGIHVGEVLLRRNAPADVARGAKPLEVEGLAKPITARIMAIAKGGQTLLSRAAYDMTMRRARDLPDLRDTVWTLHGLYKLKGISDPVYIGEVAPAGGRTQAPPKPKPKPKRSVSIRYLVGLAALLLASFIGVFDAPDLAIQQRALALIHGPMEIENTVIVAIPDQADYRKLRAEHPAVISRLVDAGVSAVVFDIAMTTATEDDDALAASMEAARDAGVPVILGMHIRQSPGGKLTAEPPESAQIRQAATLGHVEVVRETLLGTVHGGKARRRTAEGDVWAISAEALKAHINAKQPIRIDDGELVVGGTRNPVWADQIWMPPIGEAPIQDYGSEDMRDDLTGKVAVLGVYGGTQDMLRTLFGSRYGVEIHAGLIETLIRQRALWVLPRELNLFASLAVGVMTGLASWALLFRWRLVAVFVPLASLAIIISLTWAGIMTSIVSPMIAAFLGYRASSVHVE